MSCSYIFLLKIECSYTFVERLVYCLSNDFKSGSLVVHARKFDILSVTPNVYKSDIRSLHHTIWGIPNQTFGYPKSNV
jgi:hypothetical protein